MKRLLLCSVGVATLSFLLISWHQSHNNFAPTGKREEPWGSNEVHPSLPNVSVQKIAEAREFVKERGLDASYIFLVDLGLASNTNRFFVVDLRTDSVVRQGLVTHGNCNQYWLEGRKYENVVGCGCSSLGKYKIGYSYTGRFGLAFKLHGLESTNNKAFERFVVLHSHECVPESESGSDICQSNGCPTVAPAFLNYLEPIIKNSRKPVLLWIYDSKQ